MRLPEAPNRTGMTLCFQDLLASASGEGEGEGGGGHYYLESAKWYGKKIPGGLPAIYYPLPSQDRSASSILHKHFT